MWEYWWGKNIRIPPPPKLDSSPPREFRKLNLRRYDYFRERRRGERLWWGMGGSQKASLNSAFILSSSWTAHVQNSLRIALLRTNNTSWIWRRCRRNWDVCSSTVEKKKKKISECQKLKELLKMEQGGHYPSSTLHCSRCCLDIDPSYLHPLTQSL